MVAIKNMLAVINSGGAVAMFPSGNRSFFGTESTIVAGIGKLAKKFNVPLVLVQLRGGFFTKPRWKAKTNKGKMIGAVSRVVSPQEMEAMTPAEIDEIIFKELHFNDFEYNRNAKIIFRGKYRAEYLESVLFYCPECNDFGDLYSQGNEFFCRTCGARVRINETGFFEKINKAEKIPDTILEWGDKQLEFLKKYDYSVYTEKPVFSDDDITLVKAERAKGETIVGKGKIEMFADRMVICGKDFLFSETTMALQGVRKFTVYTKENLYAVYAPFRVNLAKYMMCGYRIKNLILDNKEEYYGY